MKNVTNNIRYESQVFKAIQKNNIILWIVKKVELKYLSMRNGSSKIYGSEFGADITVGLLRIENYAN